MHSCTRSLQLKAQCIDMIFHMRGEFPFKTAIDDNSNHGANKKQVLLAPTDPLIAWSYCLPRPI